MDRYLNHIIKSTEKKVDYFIKNQILDPEKLDYGGLPGHLIDVKPTVYILSNTISVYLNKDSFYYQDELIYDRILIAFDFIKRHQRQGGTFDFPSCNFSSAPDTAFCLKRLIASYRLLMKYGNTLETKTLSECLLDIIKPAIVGTMNGGFHTPNHRWAISAALLQCSNLFKEDVHFSAVLKAKANQYLAEGIDSNEDGEYAEKSTGNYNGVVNAAFISCYEETKEPRFLEYVKKNLHMMLSYIEPDDTIFTQNSTRQDKGNKQYADGYFYQFLYLANALNISEFDGAAHKIIKDNLMRGDDAPDCLYLLMLNEDLQAYTFENYGFAKAFHNNYKASGVVRVKQEKFTYTLLKDASKFLFLQAGETPIYMKIGVSYCDTRSFKPQTIEKDGDTYTLTYNVSGWYYLPFENYDGPSDWWQMDHSKRELLKNTDLELKTIITQRPDGLDIQIKSSGYDRIPIRVELCIPDQSIVENDHFYLNTTPGQGMILRQGDVNVHHKGQTIKIGSGFGTHEFLGHYSGEEKNELGYTLFFNEYTHLDKTISLDIK